MNIFKAMWGMLTGKVNGVPMIQCHEALDNLFEFLDGELDDERREAIGQHLEICKKCYPRARFEQAFLDALKAVDTGEAIPEDVRAKVMAALESETS